MDSFLSGEQIAMLGNKTKRWSNKAIIDAFKLRFSLGKHGYNYLRATGYPSPSYSTLNRRVQKLKIGTGLLKNIVSLLKLKIESMTDAEKDCCLLMDEVEIAACQDFDPTSRSFVGKTTLGKEGIGNHILLLMLRGLQIAWKQIIALHVTGSSTAGIDLKNIVMEAIDYLHGTGLNVRAIANDMASCNVSLWNSLGVKVSRYEEKTSFQVGSRTLFTLADVPHLIKNLRNALLKHCIYLPDDVVGSQGLPTKLVSAGHIKTLWLAEVNSDTSLRSLHHLSEKHLFPTHFTKMNVAVAVQLFSIKTAAALEKAVKLNQLHPDALTTAWFVRFINEWFQTMSSRTRKTSITRRNYQKKFAFLMQFCEVVEKTVFGKGWKPLNTGLIMSSKSVIQLASCCLAEGYQFFLPGRLTQDAVENVFSQIRRKAGMKPTALPVKTAIKGICISQIIADVEHSNYSTDNDGHLFSFDATENEPPEVYPLKLPSSTTHSSLTTAEKNDVYYITGGIISSVLKRYSICSWCQSYLQRFEEEAPADVKYLTEYANMGGLQKAGNVLFKMLLYTEECLQVNKRQLLSCQAPLSDKFIDDISRKCDFFTPRECCNLKIRILKSYLISRGKSKRNHEDTKSKRKLSFGSFSANKKAKL